MKTKTTLPTLQTTTQTPITTNFHGDVNAARLKAVTNPDVKNPLTFTDNTDRQAAILARMQRIISNPKYQALDPKAQVRLRSKYYDKYVAPTYKQMGVAAPDKITWIKGVVQRNRLTGGFMFGPENYYETEPRDNVARIGFAAAKNIGDILHGSLSAGVWISKQATLAQLGLSDIFTHPTDAQKADTREALKAVEKYANKVVDRISDGFIQNSNFWLQTHPSKTFVEKADSIIGEQLVQLALYEAISAGRGGIGLPANLSIALAASKIGKTTAATLGAAADGLIGSVVSGQNAHDTKANMAAFAGFTAVTHGLALAGAPLIKKFTAHVLSVGGRPLQEAITSQAEHELVNGAGPASMEELHAAHTEDPTKTKLVTAEKVSLNSLALAKHGKPLNQLSQKQRAAIRVIRGQMTSDAVREMPAHLDEVSKANAQAAVLGSQEADPEMAAWDKAMQQKHGVDFAQSLHQAELNSVEEQTGIKSTQGATRKVAKSSKAVDEQIAKTNALAREEEPRRYASFKIEHMSYFKNPAGKAISGKGGNFDYKTWLDGMDSEDFKKELTDHIGNSWFFEKPQHLLEYALTYSKEMPKPFKDRIVEELYEIDPLGTPSKWLATGKRRDEHIANLATTGRLWSEGNVFRSSNFDPGSKRTKWQLELAREAALVRKNEQKALKDSLAPLRKHFPEVDDMTLKILQKLQDIIK